MDKKLFTPLIKYLSSIPGIDESIQSGEYDEGMWFIQFKININHKLAWNIIQELACVVNYLSVNERLPTVFYPVSPAPYLNGGPADYLSWIIEPKDRELTPEILMKWLEGRLPQPVNDEEAWINEEE
jgi:hypothetical protein